MMLHVAGMSFLGLGVQRADGGMGVMINDARRYIWTSRCKCNRRGWRCSSA